MKTRDKITKESVDLASKLLQKLNSNRDRGAGDYETDLIYHLKAWLMLHQE